MLLDQVQSRIAGAITELPAERLQFAADLAELVRTNSLPNAPIAGFLLSAGARALDDGASGAGFYIQSLEETVALVLVLSASGDATGGKSVPRADDLEKRVTAAVVGWMPAAEDDRLFTTEFRFRSSNPVSLLAGRVMYQLEYVVGLQLRILS